MHQSQARSSATTLMLVYRKFAPERLLRSEAEAAAPVRHVLQTLQEHCEVAAISALLQWSTSSNSFLRLGLSVWHGHMVAGCWGGTLLSYHQFYVDRCAEEAGHR